MKVPEQLEVAQMTREKVLVDFDRGLFDVTEPRKKRRLRESLRGIVSDAQRIFEEGVVATKAVCDAIPDVAHSVTRIQDRRRGADLFA